MRVVCWNYGACDLNMLLETVDVKSSIGQELVQDDWNEGIGRSFYAALETFL